MGSRIPVTADDRPRLHKLSRRQLLNVAKARGYHLPDENIPKDTIQGDNRPSLLSLFKANGVDPNAPVPEVEWARITVKNELGQDVVQEVPIVPEHQSANQQVDYDRLIEEQANKTKEAEKVAEDQHKLIERLLERVESLEKNSVPLERATPMQLKRLCSDQGINTDGLKTKDELLKALEDGRPS